MSRWILMPFVLFTLCVNNMDRNKESLYPSNVKLGDTNFLQGKYFPESLQGFVRIADEYSARPDMYMDQEAYAAFLRMEAAAASDSLSLCILSAARSFDYQKGIWEAKWTGNLLLDDSTNAYEAYPDGRARALRIMEYSAMPGTSRHHWGTDIDLNALDNTYFETDGKELYQWLQTNASKYGYYQPYTAKGPDRPYGYNEEKWHWTYLPLSRKYTHDLATYLEKHEISGFLGDVFCDSLPILSQYVLGISPECK